MRTKKLNRSIYVLIVLSLFGGFAVNAAEQSVTLIVPGCGA